MKGAGSCSQPSPAFLRTRRLFEAPVPRLAALRPLMRVGDCFAVRIQNGNPLRNSSAFGRTVTASGHSNRFAMGRMLSADTFSYGLRSKCADLAELICSYSFFTNSARMALSTARIITPTSAKMASHILAMPSAPRTRQMSLMPMANTIFS